MLVGSEFQHYLVTCEELSFFLKALSGTFLIWGALLSLTLLIRIQKYLFMIIVLFSMTLIKT